MKNKLPEALRDIDESILEDAENGWAYRNKGIYYMLTGDNERAVKLLQQALAMDSFIDRIHFYLGMAYLRTSQKKEACEQLRMSERVGDKMAPAEVLKSCR